MSVTLRILENLTSQNYSGFVRVFSTSTTLLHQKKAIVLGIYTEKKQENVTNKTETSETYDKWLEGKLTKLLSLSKPIESGSSRLFFGTTEKCSIVSVVSLGEKNPQKNNNESLDVSRENIRKGIAAGMKSLKGLGIENVEVDVTNDPTSAAEGAFLSTWNYKKSEREKFPLSISPLNSVPDNETPLNGEDIVKKWEEGVILAEGQNFARHLMDSPANLMDPTIFCEEVKNKIESCGTKGEIKVIIRDKTWIVEQKMGAFLSVAKGSSQPPKFLEIHYTGEQNESTNPLVLVGKGVTFDSGGVSIKPSQGMEEMRADMGGAATVCSAILTAARLNIPGKVIALVPLCENMVNGEANKPGDVVMAKDGTTIQVDNTDAEGRLILADALCYAREFNPAVIVDVATLTGAMVVALGAGATGVFSNCDEMWTKLNEAGYITGDRVWRMPLYELYSSHIKPAHLADINNVGKGGRGGGACTAAAFLNHFIQKETKWMHLDIAGVMDNAKQEVPYLGSGMAGRPTRTLTEFIRRFNE
uniref:cytosol aminopeptidase-like n=1 Tax=Styela clava TaxID=7725 RepID=UPI00193A1F0B|nr:cytosol aminopeptidase-like [Styela clava]